MPTIRIETPIVSAASIEMSAFKSGTGKPAPRGLLVERHRDERTHQHGDRQQRTEPEHRNHDQVATRYRQNRAEEIGEEVRVQRARRRDENDAAGDARVEDDRKRLVTRRCRAGYLLGVRRVWTALSLRLSARRIEWLRARRRTAGDQALAIVFYTGIAGGVVLISAAGALNANLFAYLFARF